MTATGGEGCWPASCPPLDMQLHMTHIPRNCKRYNPTATGSGCIFSFSFFVFLSPTAREQHTKMGEEEGGGVNKIITTSSCISTTQHANAHDTYTTELQGVKRDSKLGGGVAFYFHFLVIFSPIARAQRKSRFGIGLKSLDACPVFFSSLKCTAQPNNKKKEKPSLDTIPDKIADNPI